MLGQDVDEYMREKNPEVINQKKKNQNTKLLKELSNSTSSLNAALDAISSQNKLLVKEITTKNESITFP